MLDRCRHSESASYYHAQMLYTVGAVFRALAGFLASHYLYDIAADHPKLNACITTDLRRPTYGNLLAFIRIAANSEGLNWGCWEETIYALRRVLRLQHPGLRGIPRGMGLPDALIRYRNTIAHGGAAATERECRDCVPSVEAALCSLLHELRGLCGWAVGTEGGPHLLHDGLREPLFPLGYQDSGPVLGIMEGYDTEKRRIRFVCIKKEWETEAPWSVWAGLLQQRGLLARDWDAIDEDWLRKRAAALLPARYRLPARINLSAQLGQDLLRCIDVDSTLPAHDCDFAVAILHAFENDRFCFVLDAADKSWTMEAHDGFSLLLGASPCLRHLPAGHPLEAMLARTSIVLPVTGEGPRVANWQNLERDFPGLRVIRVRRVDRAEPGFRGLDELGRTMFDALAAEGGQSLCWETLSSGARQWADTFEKINFLVANPHLVRDEAIDPVRVWREYLLEMWPPGLEVGRIEQLAEACRGPSPRPPAPVAQLLADAGVLRTSPDGASSFAGEWARAALYGAVLSRSTGRQQKRLADHPPLPLTQELTRELRRACQAARYQPPLLSPGGKSLLALAAVENRELPLHAPLTDPELSAVLDTCVLLVSWGRPDAVGDVILRVWEGMRNRSFASEDQTVVIASAIRRHGSPQLAEQLFQSLAGSHTPLALRAKHEFAGVLRDRGLGDDRVRAARLYAEILAEPNLATEQRIRSLCGAAENQVWLENFAEARTLLELGLTLAVGDYAAFRGEVYHRLSMAYLHEGAHAEALQAAHQVVELFHGRYQGAFAARCLDTYARALTPFGRYAEAEIALVRALDIKRALGDRLGLQKGLLQLSLLREKMCHPDAAAPAWEALQLAERSDDFLGQKYLHRRLASLRRDDPTARSYHLRRIEELTQMIQKHEISGE